MIERDWEEINVQDICDRANIGRSTYYTHFGDKGELLVSGFDDLRKFMRAQRAEQATSDDLLGFARGLIDHAFEERELFRALLGKRSGHFVQKRFRQMVTDLIKQDLAGLLSNRAHLDAVVHYVSGAFMELLTWWIDTRSSLQPDDIEALFRKLTSPALAAARTMPVR
jgi:AcrR family transcriptional regulator